MNLAWLFPGQGVQYPGMASAADAGAAQDLFALASELAGQSILELCMSGTRERLREPLLAELSLAAVSLAAARRLRRLGLPAAVAGYSAGETTALCCAGVLCEEDALRAAAIRGRVLASHVDPSSRMVNIIGLDDSLLDELLRGRVCERLTLSAQNAPKHISIAGDISLVAELASAARDHGARVEDVDVAGPWHTPRLLPASVEVFEALAALRFEPPERALFMCASGQRECEPERIRRLYAYQLSVPVRWVDVIDAVSAEQRVTTWIDAGPGRMLYAYLMRSRRVRSQSTVVAAERLRGLAAQRRFITQMRSRQQDGLQVSAK